MGTFKSIPPTAVSSTLAKLTSLSESQVQVKRKYKLGNKIVHWWFVLRGDEEMLCKVDSEWEKVSLQMNWKLEPVLNFTTTDTDAEFHPENPPESLPSNPPHQATLQ